MSDSTRIDPELRAPRVDLLLGIDPFVVVAFDSTDPHPGDHFLNVPRRQLVNWLMITHRGLRSSLRVSCD